MFFEQRVDYALLGHKRCTDGEGVHFALLQDAGDPVACARAYCEAGADELAFLDVTATIEGRKTMLKTVRDVAVVTTVPFTVGGGIKNVAEAEAVLAAGTDRVSISSAAVRNPCLIDEAVKLLGREKVVVAIDVDLNQALPSGYEVYIDGGNKKTGKDAIEWAKEAEVRGAAIILPTSKAWDRAKTGYDLPLIRGIRAAVGVLVVLPQVVPVSWSIFWKRLRRAPVFSWQHQFFIFAK